MVADRLDEVRMRMEGLGSTWGTQHSSSIEREMRIKHWLDGVSRDGEVEDRETERRLDYKDGSRQRHKSQGADGGVSNSRVLEAVDDRYAAIIKRSYGTKGSRGSRRED